MATRFDRVTTTTRPRVSEIDLELEALVRRPDLDLVQVHVPAHVPRALPTRATAGAMMGWLALVFATCYLGLPLLFALTGVTSGILATAPYALPAFAMASFVAIIGVALAQPRVRLDVWGPRDPVLSATLGGLGVWAVVHNTSALLLPFSAMGPVELLGFFGLNVLEMTMLGMMFASFTRRRSVAMALGGGFQLLVLGFVLTLMSLAGL